MTKPLYHISRNFVEFGAFTALEVVAFKERGVVSERDYVRSEENPNWLPLGIWMEENGSALAAAKPAPAKAKSAAPRKRAASAAKAPKKAA